MTEAHTVYYVVTYVPEANAKQFIEEISVHIPKVFGDYDHVVWWSAPKVEKGTEQFRPLEGADPVQGTPGAIEQADSVRVEFCVPRDEAVLMCMQEKIKARHPWGSPVVLVFEGKLQHT